MARSVGDIVGKGLSQVPDWQDRSGDEIKDKIAGYSGRMVVGGYADGALEFIETYEANGGTSEDAIAHLVEVSKDPAYADKPFLVEGKLNPDLAAIAKPEAPAIDGPSQNAPSESVPSEGREPSDGYDIDWAEARPAPMPEIGGNINEHDVDPGIYIEGGGTGKTITHGQLELLPYITSENTDMGDLLGDASPQILEFLDGFLPPEVVEVLMDGLDLLSQSVSSVGNENMLAVLRGDALAEAAPQPDNALVAKVDAPSPSGMC